MIGSCAATVLEKLHNLIASANSIGNIEGLFAQFIIGNDSRIDIEWNVNCDEFWIDKDYDPSNLSHVSALGYTINNFYSESFLSALENGFERAIKRDLDIIDNGSILNEITALIGLVLGAAKLQSRSPKYIKWCETIIKRMLAQQNPLNPILFHIGFVCNITLDKPLPYTPNNASIYYLAALEWSLNQNAEPFSITSENRNSLRDILIDRLLTESFNSSPGRAALLWYSLRKILNDKLPSLTKSPLLVSFILNQFESCLLRWRWDDNTLKNPVRWLIRSEREVQDILWIILRGFFQDLEFEDTLPKFGHSTYKADFGITSLGLLIEVKFARSASAFKDIEKEVLEDIKPYLSNPDRYKEIIVFIYDDSCSTQEHATTKRALCSVEGVTDVIIVSRPSILPDAKERQKWEGEIVKK